jgi:ribonuclease D
VIGLDAEWQPTRNWNETNRIALVQVAGYDECQLHHVHRYPFFPPNLRAVLENPNILKVGAGIEQDVRKLRFDWGVEVKTYLDLSPLALHLDPFWGERAYRRGSMIALVRLVARYLRRCVDKEQQCSNWENLDLTESQRTCEPILSCLMPYLNLP